MCGCSGGGSSGNAAFGSTQTWGGGVRLRYRVDNKGSKVYYSSETDAKRHVSRHGGTIVVMKPGQR